MIGHPQGAVAQPGWAATVLGLRDQIFHPTINLDLPDPECDLDYIPNVAREIQTEVALCNCIAFGSKKQLAGRADIIPLNSVRPQHEQRAGSVSKRGICPCIGM